MTDADIIKALANKVMGWRVIDQNKPDSVLWFSIDENRTLFQWNPLESIADAWMLVEKAKQHKDIIKIKTKTMKHETRCLIVKGQEPDSFGCYLVEFIDTNKLAPRAISMAIAKAYGVSDDNR